MSKNFWYFILTVYVETVVQEKYLFDSKLFKLYFITLIIRELKGNSHWSRLKTNYKSKKIKSMVQRSLMHVARLQYNELSHVRTDDSATTTSSFTLVAVKSTEL